MQRNFQNVVQFRTGPCLPHLYNPNDLPLIHRLKSTATPAVEFAITSTKSRQAYQALLPRYPAPLGPSSCSQKLFPGANARAVSGTPSTLTCYVAIDGEALFPSSYCATKFELRIRDTYPETPTSKACEDSESFKEIVRRKRQRPSLNR